MNLDAWRHYLRGRLFQLLRNLPAAIASYRDALVADPAFARAAHNLAFLLAQDNRYAEAESALRVATRHNPVNANAWFNLGYLCDRQQKIAEAITAFSEAVRLNPKLDRAWYGLGHCHAMNQDDAIAVPAFERAIQIDPMNWHAWIAMGMCFHRLEQPDKVRDVAMHLNRYQRRLARQLIRDTGRSDLEHLIADLEP
jgi:tetratricopeptide (TPR) repeat protein